MARAEAVAPFKTETFLPPVLVLHGCALEAMNQSVGRHPLGSSFLPNTCFSRALG